MLLGRLSPIPRTQAELQRIRDLIGRCDELSADADHTAFARLNMAFFAEISAMTGNLPLREISERLYYQTTRIVLKMLPLLNLAEEVQAFRQEMTEILAALQVGDLESVGHLRRAHISMSLNRMLRYAAEAAREGAPA